MTIHARHALKIGSSTQMEFVPKLTIFAKHQMKPDHAPNALKDMTLKMVHATGQTQIQQDLLISDAITGIGILKFAWRARKIGYSIKIKFSNSSFD